MKSFKTILIVGIIKSINFNCWNYKIIQTNRWQHSTSGGCTGLLIQCSLTNKQVAALNIWEMPWCSGLLYIALSSLPSLSHSSAATRLFTSLSCLKHIVFLHCCIMTLSIWDNTYKFENLFPSKFCEYRD